jgi:hypothetical protein
MVNVRPARGGERAAEPWIPHQVEAGRQRFLAQSAALFAAARAQLDDVDIAPFTQCSNETADVAGDSTLGLPQVRGVD